MVGYVKGFLFTKCQNKKEKKDLIRENHDHMQQCHIK